MNPELPRIRDFLERVLEIRLVAPATMASDFKTGWELWKEHSMPG